MHPIQLAIINSREIESNGSTPTIKKLRKDAISILTKALLAVDPKKAVMRKLKLNPFNIEIDGSYIMLKDIHRIFVIGGGKAGGSMAEAVEAILGDMITAGLVNVLKGTEERYSLKKIKLIGASHPIPDDEGVQGVKEMLSLIQNLTPKDVVIVLISGGGSALMPFPADEVSLMDIKMITSKLLRRGASIEDLNAIRKHLDALKGGQLARLCMPAKVISLILSDVVGDPLDTISSGLTVPDSTTFSNAKDALKKYQIWNEAPEGIRKRIEQGIIGLIEETPKIRDSIFERVTNIVVANNAVAAEAALEEAKILGYNGMILSTMIEGESRHVGSVLAGIAKEIKTNSRPIEPPAVLIAGGESTVVVSGQGKGGRNQELVLGAARKIRGLPCVIVSLATDGIDGPTEAAGAIVDGFTVEKSLTERVSIEDSLRENDSFNFFKVLGDGLYTGPTGTNVNDLALVLVGEGSV